jgi:hypothetical protein
MIAAVRHNNPGNVSLPIKGWHGGGKIVGISGQPGYAEFPTMEIGFEAFKQRLRSYINDHHYTSIALMAPHYAADPHWGSSVARLSGIGIREHLSTADGDQMAALASGIIKQETGHTIAELIKMRKEYEV